MEINKRQLIDKKVEDFLNTFKEYGYWDIVFSALRCHYSNEEISKSNLYRLTDDEFYTALCKAYTNELKISNRLNHINE